MALLTANGEAVINGMLSLVSAGRSLAELYLSTDKSSVQVGAATTLTWQDGTEDEMTCTRAGLDKGLWRVLLVGGTGGVSKTLRPKYYSGIAARSVLSDLLNEVGEVPGTLSTTGALEHYVRQAGLAHEAIDIFLTLYPELAWRIGRDGRVNISKPNWPTDTRDLNITATTPADGVVTLSLDQGIDAGVTLGDLGQVDRVTHMIGKSNRTEVYLR
jgi:hypothetical protein